jgi:hypothetical protein
MPCVARAQSSGEVCTEENVLQTYSKARGYCMELADYYEVTGTAINSSHFWIAAVGTVSGAVLSPIASGSAKTAWSGISGSANALQSSLNENFSNAVNVRRRQEIAGAGKVSRQEVADAKDNLKKVLASIDMAYECRMAIGIADAAAIKAINDLQQSSVPGKTAVTSAAISAPAETQKQAGNDAEKAAVLAGKAAATASVPITATAADKIVIERAGAAAAQAAASAAAPAAAQAATQTTTLSNSGANALSSRELTQAAAQAAAQVAAQAPAQRSATQAIQGMIPPGSTENLRQAVIEASSAAASAAAAAAAKAAAATVTAPSTAETAQPIDIK